MDLFNKTLSGMTDNNEINDAQFNDWQEAESAICLYAESELEEATMIELDLANKLLNKIISTNGEFEEEARTIWQNEIYA